MKKALIIFSVSYVIIYLLIGRTFWFSELDKHALTAHKPLYSEPIDLSKKHTFTWKIPASEWEYGKGLTKLFLVFTRTSQLEGKDYWKKQFDLKVTMNAYAITENEVRDDRLIQNYFFPTNEPMKNKSNLWAGWSDEKAEYRLGSVMRFVKEDTFIEFTITSPDAVLATTTPRLKIVGDYDPAVLGHLIFLKMLRDIGLLLCIILLSWVSFLALKKDSN